MQQKSAFKESSATYRLQFGRHFTFQNAREIAPYLARLGVTHCYSSPLFLAAPGSTHGYDCCNPAAFDPGIGSSDDFNQFVSQLRSLHLGLIIDIVPNHMAAHAANPWWWSLLKSGPQSEAAPFFDVDWSPTHPQLKNRILIPVLEAHYEEVLASGKIRVAQEQGELVIAYHDHRFPLSPESLALIPEVLPLPPAALHDLLERQNYQLAFWRTAAHEINYRRFFEVSSLAGLRMENPHVFNACHQLIFQLVQHNQCDGIRVDHPDGLFDPSLYFQMLRSHTSSLRNGQPLFIVAEKILAPHESIPADWPIDGTTGYDFLNQLNGIFIHPKARPILERFFREFTGHSASFPDVEYAAKKDVLEQAFASELNRLTRRLWHIATSTRSGCDFSEHQIRSVLAELIASFPVYRTYTCPNSIQVLPQDRIRILRAAELAQSRQPRLDPVVLQWTVNILLLNFPDDLGAQHQSLSRQWICQFQQLTSPLAAKGVEDTAFYRYYPLASLNEVGGNPSTFGCSLDSFHQWNSERALSQPLSLSATSTHDTKRGEDTRARINVLSEIPELWTNKVSEWSALNQSHKRSAATAAPSRTDEYLFYQTLISAWPSPAPITTDEWRHFSQRLQDYLLKAAKESKLHTSWTQPDPVYESGLQSFGAKTLANHPGNRFLNYVRAFQPLVAFFGAINSLAQTAIKLTAPGTPDLYQGTELWDLTLVDPDNRQPVDFQHRQTLLEEIERQTSQNGPEKTAIALLERFTTGEVKLFVTWQILHARQRNPRLFQAGTYTPLQVRGPFADHVIAFARSLQDTYSITVAPRFCAQLTHQTLRWPLGNDVWRDTAVHLPFPLPAIPPKNVITDQPLPRVQDHRILIAEILSSFPLAVFAP